MNNTHEPITYKVWTVDHESVTQNNLTTIISKKIQAKLIQDDPRVIDQNGQHYRYSGLLGRVEFETTCEEQELMLKLLYGNKLKLMMVNHVSPHSIVHSNV